MSTSPTTLSLKALRDAGYTVAANYAGNDERAVRVFSTAAGKALEPRVAEVRREVEASTGLSEPEFKALRHALHTLRATIEASGD